MNPNPNPEPHEPEVSTDNHPDPMKTLRSRFEAKVDRSGDCWLWTGEIVKGDYGRIRTPEGRKMAHVVAYELEHGPVPDGLQVDHRCHVRRCVRPSHLRAATIKQNQENRAGATRASKTGVRGVYKVGDRYRAQARHNGKQYSNGTHNTIEEAAVAAEALRLHLYGKEAA